MKIEDQLNTLYLTCLSVSLIVGHNLTLSFLVIFSCELSTGNLFFSSYFCSEADISPNASFKIKLFIHN